MVSFTQCFGQCVCQEGIIKAIHVSNSNNFSLAESRLCHSVLRTVPTIVIAHMFCASRDTRVSYR